jgi:hypothetical protein
VAHYCNLATWEAEIRRIVVRGQSGQKVHKTLSQPIVVQKAAAISSIVVLGQCRQKSL